MPTNKINVGDIVYHIASRRRIEVKEVFGDRVYTYDAFIGHRTFHVDELTTEDLSGKPKRSECTCPCHEEGADMMHFEACCYFD